MKPRQRSAPGLPSTTFSPAEHKLNLHGLRLLQTCGATHEGHRGAHFQRSSPYPHIGFGHSPELCKRRTRETCASDRDVARWQSADIVAGVCAGTLCVLSHILSACATCQLPADARSRHGATSGPGLLQALFHAGSFLHADCSCPSRATVPRHVCESRRVVARCVFTVDSAHGRTGRQWSFSGL